MYISDDKKIISFQRYMFIDNLYAKKFGYESYRYWSNNSTHYGNMYMFLRIYCPDYKYKPPIINFYKNKKILFLII